jgi:predicted MFS family arabinose efflux permease
MLTLDRPIVTRARPAPAVALFLTALAGQASVLVISPLLPRIAEALHASIGSAGQLRTVSGGVAAATALLLGRRARGLELRTLLATGLGLLVLGALAGAAAPTLPVMMLAQVPIGLGTASVLVGTVAASAAWTPPEQRTRVLGWTLVGQAVSWVVGMPVVGLVAATAGWRAALCALPVAACLLALGALRAAPAGRSAAAADGLGWLRRPGVARWAAGELLAYSAWSATLVFAGALFATTYGAGPLAVGIVLGAGAAAYLPGNFAARRWVERSPRASALALAAAATLVAPAVYGARSSLPLSIALFALMSAIGGGRTLAGSARGLELAGSHPVSSSGIRAAALQLGYLVGAGLGGTAVSLGGLTALGVLLGAVFAGAAFCSAPRRGEPA